MKYILSYGGGINSSALFFHLVDLEMPLDLVIFADTGEELSQTYDAVNRMRKECAKRSIEFVTVQSDKGNLYDYYLNHKIVMSMMKRDCTAKFKIRPIRNFLRERFGKSEQFTLYIGITFDEFHRIRESDVSYIVNAFPFVDSKITRQGNLDILRVHNFVAQKSGCKGCMYNKKANWIRMLRNDPKEFERHLRLEENNKNFPKVLINGSYSLRSLKDAFENQSSLESFGADPEPSCQVYGGCFL